MFFVHHTLHFAAVAVSKAGGRAIEAEHPPHKPCVLAVVMGQQTTRGHKQQVGEEFARPVLEPASLEEREMSVMV